jgi:hypothetical protein
MTSKEEDFILKVLAKTKTGEMGFKELNEKCAEHFEGCRIILKKLKEQGLVAFEGAVPAFGAKIKLVRLEDRDLAIKKAKSESSPSIIAGGDIGDAMLAILQLLKDNGGNMLYKDMNDTLSERFPGLRLTLKKMKQQERIDYDGDIPTNATEIRSTTE